MKRTVEHLGRNQPTSARVIVDEHREPQNKKLPSALHQADSSCPCTECKRKRMRIQEDQLKKDDAMEKSWKRRVSKPSYFPRSSKCPMDEGFERIWKGLPQEQDSKTSPVSATCVPEYVNEENDENWFVQNPAVTRIHRTLSYNRPSLPSRVPVVPIDETKTPMPQLDVKPKIIKRDFGTEPLLVSSKELSTSGVYAWAAWRRRITGESQRRGIVTGFLQSSCFAQLLESSRTSLSLSLSRATRTNRRWSCIVRVSSRSRIVRANRRVLTYRSVFQGEDNAIHRGGQPEVDREPAPSAKTTNDLTSFKRRRRYASGSCHVYDPLCELSCTYQPMPVVRQEASAKDVRCATEL